MIQKQFAGFKIKQRQADEAVSFFVFAANVKDITQWATVDRIEDREGGIQRRLSTARLRAIARFFNQDSRNVIPTSIVLAFQPKTTKFTRVDTPEALAIIDNIETVEWGTLSFSFDPDLPAIERPALIVDGQHRLLGMAQVDEELPVLVSALLDAEANEQAFQFIVINNKVTRVPSDHVRSLIVDFNEEALQERLETARVSLRPHALLVAIVDDDVESPFYQMVNWERRRGEGIAAVKPAAIEDCFKFIRRSFIALDEDQDALIDFFFSMWNGVKTAYPALWENTENRLFENAGFKAFSEYLTDQLETLAGAGIEYVDLYDRDAVTSTVQMIVSKIDPNFWLAEWNLKSLDTSAGREVIKNDIKVIRQNRVDRKPWDSGLKLVGAQED